MSVAILKRQIKSALDRGKDAEQTTDKEIVVADIREKIADDISKAVQTYIKTSLSTVIGGGTPLPQDGGASLKTTMQALISNI